MPSKLESGFTWLPFAVFIWLGCMFMKLGVVVGTLGNILSGCVELDPSPNRMVISCNGEFVPRSKMRFEFKSIKKR